MPKLKTRKAAAKRFRVTGSGKFMRRKPYRSHLLEHKTTARKRKLAQDAVIHDTDCERVSLMMPYA
jgi:large subunit ribosomal protein L35